jgi:hypothetical protein
MLRRVHRERGRLNELHAGSRLLTEEVAEEFLKARWR